MYIDGLIQEIGDLCGPASGVSRSEFNGEVEKIFQRYGLSILVAEHGAMKNYLIENGKVTQECNGELRWVRTNSPVKHGE